MATAACTARVNRKVYRNSIWLWPWKSTCWHVEPHTTLHAVHVGGVPGRVSGVDAASCKSVGNTGGSGDFFTNSYLLVVCICDYLRYIVLHLCITQTPGEYRINFISLLILSIFYRTQVSLGSDLWVLMYLTARLC